MATTIHWNKALLLAKKETGGYGVEPTPVVATDGMIAYDVNFTPTRETEVRPDSVGTFGEMGVMLGRQYCTFSFKTLTYGGLINVEPIEKPLVEMCNVEYTDATAEVAGSLTPLTGEGASTTLWLYRDGAAYKINGCRANPILRMGAGKAVEWEFNGMGIYTQIATLAFPEITKVSGTPVVARSAGLSIAAATVKAENVVLDFGNEVSLSPCVNAATGMAEVNIVKRAPRLTADPEATVALAATWEALIDNQTSIDISYGAIGAATYGLNVAIGNGKMLELTPAERNGKMIYNMTIVPCEDAATDDDFTIEFAPAA